MQYKQQYMQNSQVVHMCNNITYVMLSYVVTHVDSMLQCFITVVPMNTLVLLQVVERRSKRYQVCAPLYAQCVQRHIHILESSEFGPSGPTGREFINGSSIMKSFCYRWLVYNSWLAIIHTIIICSRSRLSRRFTTKNIPR